MLRDDLCEHRVVAGGGGPGGGYAEEEKNYGVAGEGAPSGAWQDLQDHIAHGDRNKNAGLPPYRKRNGEKEVFNCSRCCLKLIRLLSRFSIRSRTADPDVAVILKNTAIIKDRGAFFL
jgi:hypothetical protein